ncbi:hypothetical protein [Tersicoccus sp. Bi-70]|uniref:hypothetical protein n=1 Tax=Tersicoccus sp. Bi-70 TaxID=1897634 RepID=UPI000977FCF5|nr:hypothetical protein [Tersicoccus sp. Bi-70]OMH34404.1 hypothetical protein BGP79_04690 [Tersicoccus sp. Bi-70]
MGGSTDGTATTSALPTGTSGVPRGGAGIDLIRLWTGAATGVVAYVGVLVFTLLAIVLALLGAADLTSSSAAASAGANAVDPWSLLVPGAVQLIAMAHLGTLGASVSGALPFFGTLDGSAALFAVPLAVTAVTALAVALVSALAERFRPSAGRLQAAVQAAVTGVVLSALVNTVAVLAGITLPSISTFRVDGVHAAGFVPVIVAFLLGTGAAWAGRRLGSRGRWAAGPAAATPTVPADQPVAPARGMVTVPDLVAAARAVPAALLTHLAVVVVVALPVLVLLYAVGGHPQAILSLPLTLLNLAGYILVAGHLGPLHQTAHATQLSSRSRSGTDTDQLLQAVAGIDALNIPAWAGWCAVVLAVVATVLAGIVLGLRRPSRDAAGWLVTPLAWAAAGAVVTVLLAATARVDIRGIASAEGGFGPSWWFVLIFAAWGLGVELTARVLAPVVAPALPARLRRLLTPRPRATAPGDPAATTDAAGAGAETTGTTAPVAAARTPMSPRAKRRALILGAVAGVVVIALIAGIVITNVIRGNNGPDKQVTAYLQALVDGDAEKALSLGHTDLSAEKRVLLTNAVYRAATNRIDGFTILGTEHAGNRATVRAELRQGERTRTKTYVLDKRGGDLFDDHWSLTADDTDTATISVSGQKDARPKVNGTEVAVKTSAFSSTARLSAAVLPGTYTVSLPGGSTWVAAEDATIETTIDGDGDTSARLELTTTDAFATEVERQVKDKIAACAKSTDLEPTGCPFRGYASGDTRKVVWTVSDAPSIRVSSIDSGSGWRFYATDPADAKVTYEEDQSFGDEKPKWTKESDTDSFYVSGKASIQGDTVTVDLNDY